jgi:hypothetical protein
MYHDHEPEHKWALRGVWTLKELGFPLDTSIIYPMVSGNTINESVTIDAPLTAGVTHGTIASISTSDSKRSDPSSSISLSSSNVHAVNEIKTTLVSSTCTIIDGIAYPSLDMKERPMHNRNSWRAHINAAHYWHLTNDDRTGSRKNDLDGGGLQTLRTWAGYRSGTHVIDFSWQLTSDGKKKKNHKNTCPSGFFPSIGLVPESDTCIGHSAIGAVLLNTESNELMGKFNKSLGPLRGERPRIRFIVDFTSSSSQQPTVSIWYNRDKKGTWTFAELGLPMNQIIYAVCSSSCARCCVTIDAPLDGRPPTTSTATESKTLTTSLIGGIAYPPTVTVHPSHNQNEWHSGDHDPAFWKSSNHNRAISRANDDGVWRTVRSLYGYESGQHRVDFILPYDHTTTSTIQPYYYIGLVTNEFTGWNVKTKGLGFHIRSDTGEIVGGGKSRPQVLCAIEYVTRIRFVMDLEYCYVSIQFDDDVVYEYSYLSRGTILYPFYSSSAVGLVMTIDAPLNGFSQKRNETAASATPSTPTSQDVDSWRIRKGIQHQLTSLCAPVAASLPLVNAWFAGHTDWKYDKDNTLVSCVRATLSNVVCCTLRSQYGYAYGEYIVDFTSPDGFQDSSPPSFAPAAHSVDLGCVPHSFGWDRWQRPGMYTTSSLGSLTGFRLESDNGNLRVNGRCLTSLGAYNHSSGVKRVRFIINCNECTIAIWYDDNKKGEWNFDELELMEAIYPVYSTNSNIRICMNATLEIDDKNDDDADEKNIDIDNKEQDDDDMVTSSISSLHCFMLSFTIN